jgi:hypothetical protein
MVLVINYHNHTVLIKRIEKRIPLGGKDTNARTMQTKPQKPIVKQTSGRRRVKTTSKPEITRELTVASGVSIADDLPDIEYMPPRAKGKITYFSYGSRTNLF